MNIWKWTSVKYNTETTGTKYDMVFSKSDYQ